MDWRSKCGKVLGSNVWLMSSSSATAMFLAIVSVMVLVSLAPGVAPQSEAENQDDACFVWKMEGDKVLDTTCPPPEPNRASLHLHQDGTHVHLKAQFNVKECGESEACINSKLVLVLKPVNSTINGTKHSLHWEAVYEDMAEDVKLQDSGLGPAIAGEDWASEGAESTYNGTVVWQGVLKRTIVLGGREFDLLNDKWMVSFFQTPLYNNQSPVTQQASRKQAHFLFRPLVQEDESQGSMLMWGLVIAGIGLLLVIIAIVICVCLRRRGNKRPVTLTGVPVGGQ